MIKEQEIRELKRFASLYSAMHTRISNMEALIKKLDQEKNDLINELEYTRQEEMKFTSDLVERYGSEIMNSKQIKDAVTSAIRT